MQISIRIKPLVATIATAIIVGIGIYFPIPVIFGLLALGIYMMWSLIL